MKNPFITLTVLILLLSCTNRQEAHNSENYADGSETSDLSMDNMIADTTKLLNVDFPVYFDSTKVLIHPIGFINMDVKSSKSINDKLRLKSKSDDYYDSYPNAYNNGDRISGSITNLYFDDVEHNAQYILTDRVLNIITIDYLRELSKNINRNYLLYSVYDEDSNGDRFLQYPDVLACYISNLNGTEFKKISPDNQQYIPGVWVLWANRYYFKTIEDTNNDGQFDQRDKTHYYYIDFNTIPYRVIEYNPLIDK